MDHNNHINTVENQPKNVNKKRERNRIKKKKYKLKIKHKRANTTPKYTKPSLTVKTNRGWRWFTLKSKQLSLKQKKLLFQAHNLYKIKERNSALIFQLQCQLNTIFFKDKNSAITTSTTSSSNQTPASLQEDIATLHSHNSHLQLRIKTIKQSQLTNHSKHTSFLKSSHQLNKGHQLRHQLNKINNTHRLFLHLLQTRHTLSSSNTAHIMEQNLKSQRATFTESEKILFFFGFFVTKLAPTTSKRLLRRLNKTWSPNRNKLNMAESMMVDFIAKRIHHRTSYVWKCCYNAHLSNQKNYLGQKG